MGVFYQPLVYSGSASYAPGYVLTNSIPTQSGVPTISLSNPYPNLSTTASGNTFGLSTSIGSSLTVIDQNRKAPLYESYSADIQRDLPWGLALKVGYVGGHSRNQPDALNINQLADGNYSQGTALDTKVSNPYAGLGFWSTGKQSYNQTIRPFPSSKASRTLKASATRTTTPSISKCRSALVRASRCSPPLPGPQTGTTSGAQATPQSRQQRPAGQL